MSYLHCVISNLRTLSGWRSCLKCINIMRNILMLVIFWHIDSHKASCSKMNCSPVPGCENGAVVGFCLLFVWAQIVFTFPPPADFELAQLQEKLRETELVMENIVSNAHHSPDRWVCYLLRNHFTVSLLPLVFPTGMTS